MGPVQHVVGARPDVYEGQRPEADHGEPVAVQRRIGRLRNEVVGQRQPDGSKNQADSVVHVHPVEIGLIDAGGERGGEVAGDVDERRPEDGAHDVPDGDVHLLILAPRDGGEDVRSEHHPGKHYQNLQRARQFGIFQAVIVAAHERNHRAQNDHVPDHGSGDTQLLAKEFDAAQPRHNVTGQAPYRQPAAIQTAFR